MLLLVRGRPAGIDLRRGFPHRTMPGELVNGGLLKNNERERQIYGNPKVFKKCMVDKKFAYVVALARAVNALNSAHSLMMSTADMNTPVAIRDRMNGLFLCFRNSL